MIAMLLAAQLSAQLPTNPNVRELIAPRAGIIKALPGRVCAAAGRLEVSLGQPVALYRKGDRPPKMLSGWNDYPDPASCLAEATR